MAALAIAASAAIALVASPASGHHVPSGSYSGTVENGGTVTFDVSSDGSKVNTFTAENVPGSICNFPSTSLTNLTITNHAFSWTGAFQGTGSFASSQNASGTLRINSGGCDTGTENWSATTTDGPAAQCFDGADNDGDTQIDFPSDPGCASSSDDDETDPNSPPVVTTTGSDLSYTEGDGPVAVDNALSVTDSDDTNLASATVDIGSGFTSAEDDLAFADQLGITGSYDDSTGTLTLTGTASVSDYETALRSVTYENNSQNPTTGPRTVSFQTNDGTDNSTAATRDVSVAAVNDPPTLNTTGSTLSYTEGDGPVAVDNGLTAGDVDDTNLQSATVDIGSGFSSAEDDLAFTNQLGITGVYNDSTGTLTLSGTASVADYQTALRSVTYENSSSSPSTATRTVSFQTTDGTDSSTAPTRDISVASSNQPPAVGTTGGSLSYTEGDGPVAVDNALTVTDSDDTNLEGATVDIGSGFSSAQDDLAFTNQLGITGVYDDSTGTLTLTGTASVANYQTALRSVTYENSSDNPSTATRAISFQVDDGDDSSLLATRNVSVTGVNDAPVLDTTNSSLSYTEGNPETIVDPGLTVTDPDDTNLNGAQVRISSNFEAATDELSFNDQLGITGTYNSGTGVLTLTGTALVSDYQAALRDLKFRSTSADPAPSKTVAFLANDGDVDSAEAFRNVSISGVNDVPTVDTTGSTLTYTEGQGPVAVDNGLTVSDPDDAQLEGATATISFNHSPAQDDLAFTNQLGITGVYNDSTGTLTLTGTASVADYQTALRSVTYQNVSSNPTTGSRTVSFRANDGDGESATANRFLQINSTQQCSDGADNDGDGGIDMADPGCSSPFDDDELNPPSPPTACSDGFDNDGDGRVDLGDPGCTGPADTSEFNPAPPPPPPACSDGLDNDGDGRVDLADPGCSAAFDGDESNPIDPGPDGDGGGGGGGNTPTELSLTIPSKWNLASALNQGVTATVACPAACRIGADLLLARGTAASVGLAAKPVVVGRGSKRLTSAGTTTVRVKFTSKARSRLRRLRRFKLKLRTKVATAAGTRTINRNLTLSRSVPANRPPAFPSPMRFTIQESYTYDSFGRLTGVFVTIVVLSPATDPDRDPLTYSWTATTGSVVGNGLSAVWRAPIVFGTPGSGDVTITARDGRGGTDTFTFEFE